MPDSESHLVPTLVPTLIPLVYNNNTDLSSVRNVLLIDSNVSESQLFYDSANSNTFPIKYSYTSQKTELLELLRNKFQNGIDRISFIFHDPSVLEKAFLDNACFFVSNDLLLDQAAFSENFVFLTGLVNEFNITHFDFLACNTLNRDNWKRFYELLSSQSGVICGASNNKTGNLMYGADWLMENTNEVIKNIYFNDNIDNYASTLAATTISQNGGTIYIRQSGSDIQYSLDNSSWTTILSTDFPINIQNTNPVSGNVLTVQITTNLTVSNVNLYFVSASNYITFDGTNKTVTILNVINYEGFLENGTGPSNGFSNINVQNFITTASGSTISVANAWLCQEWFGSGTGNITNITNCSNIGDNAGICGRNIGASGGTVNITNCSNSGSIPSSLGGICRQNAGAYGGTVNITNCSNSGTIGNGSGGIVGSYAGYDNGTVNITNCYNTSDINGYDSGGICGTYAGNTNGTITINKCYNTGNNNGSWTGGITGWAFAYNTNNTCSITNCYSTGSINQTTSGGICATNPALTTSLNYTPILNITNCYSLGTIGSSCGGILGGPYTSYAKNPVITLTNCYSAGTYVNANSGLVAINLPVPVTINNCYAANGTWSDTNANSQLTGFPATSPGIGASWGSIQANTPYLSTAFNNQLYDPSSASVSSNTYITGAGIQPNSTYAIINNIPSTTNSIVPSSGVITYTNLTESTTTNVVAYNNASSTNKYYGYNINNFTITYILSPTTITNFYIPVKTIGDAPFTITDPSSNSSGAFSYTSSNTSVATISGNVVTIVGVGQSIITATQAPYGDYDEGTATTIFSVQEIITNGTELLSFMNTTTTYGVIMNSIIEVNDDLTASSQKILSNGTNEVINITKTNYY